MKNFFNFVNENINYDKVQQDIFSRINQEDLKRYMEDNNWDEGDEEFASEYYLRDEHSINIDSDGIVEFDKLNDDVSELIGNNLVKLYHFTAKKFEKSVLKDGLIPGLKKTNPYKNTYSGIYLTTRTSGNEIEGYKHIIRNKWKSEVIRIDLKLYLDEIEPDIDDIDLVSGETQFISQEISPDRILNIEEVL